MSKNRRDILRLASGGWAASLLALLSPKARASGRGHDDIDKSVPSRLDTMPMPLDREHLSDPGLARRIKEISNVFEVGRPEPDYAYVEDLGDGRGYTVTQYGFCTYNSEVTQVIERYAAKHPSTPLKRFLPELPPQKWTDQELDDFPHVWRREIRSSPLLGEACDKEADFLYFDPAVESAAAVGVTSPVGIAIFYDTLLQHGAATDPDSLPSILKRTLEKYGDVGDTSEPQFLRAFLKVRRSVLENASNHETRQVWRQSARRVDALLGLLDANPNLVPPITVANADVTATIL
ncbi:chitosanase [Hyphomicrobium sp. 1Nfss2.1]|uniref:chitosanase n=1 Tax=Hyphomicrobium sp. 1Nfss2.1 TaxID=3413936 RepID=UPI003C7A5261